MPLHDVGHRVLADAEVAGYPAVAPAGVDRAPFDAEIERLADEMDGVLEYRYGEQTAIGLGLASWRDEMAVSVDVEPWRTEIVELRRDHLFENDDGKLVEETSNVRARNAANVTHLHAHEDWLRSRPGTWHGRQTNCG